MTNAEKNLIETAIYVSDKFRHMDLQFAISCTHKSLLCDAVEDVVNERNREIERGSAIRSEAVERTSATSSETR